MSILLINPPRVGGLPVVREERYEHRDMGACYPPLDLLRVGGMLARAGRRVRLLDCNRAAEPEALVPLAVGFEPQALVARVGFDTQDADARFLLRLKELCAAPLIVRNLILAQSDEYRRRFLERHPGIDCFCETPFETSLPAALARLAGGSCPGGLELDPAAGPDYSLLGGLHGYHTGIFDRGFATVFASTGCPHACSFCAYAGTPYRERPVAAVLADIETLYHDHRMRRALFFDDNFALDEERGVELCRGIEGLGLDLTWSGCLRADAATPALVRAMRRAGCVELALGVESGDPAVLERSGKGVTVEQIRAAAKACHGARLPLYAMCIIGLPGETAGSVANTIELVRGLKTFYAQFCFSTPFPNTPNYRYYRDNELLLSRDPERFFPLAARPVARTRALDADELVRWRLKAYRAVSLNPVRLLGQVRVTDWRWNLRGLTGVMRRLAALRRGEPFR